MKLRTSLVLGSALALLPAGLVFAADPWQPMGELFALNFRFASITLLMVAAGIALGLLGIALFRIRGARLNAAAGSIRRHSAGHMLTHWLVGIGFLLGIYTGALLLDWLPFALGLRTTYLLHYIGSSAILLGLMATIVYALTRGTTSKHRLIPTWKQIGQVIVDLFAYAGLVGDRGILGFKGLQWPAAIRREVEKTLGFKGFHREGKYLVTEKVLSYPLWALVSLAVVATGLLKAARYAYPMGGDVIKWSTIIHDWAAVASVIMLGVHVAAVALVRTNWPLMRSMFTGKISAAHIQAVHGEWYDELVAEAQRSGTDASRAMAAPAESRGD